MLLPPHPLSFPLKVKVAQSCPTLCNPMDYTVHGILQARILEWVAFPFSRGSSQPRDWTHEPQRKPKNTGVGSLSLLQGIFLTQESNQGLLQCRRILYQVSHQGSTITVGRKRIYWVNESFLGGWCAGDLTCRWLFIDPLSCAVWMCGKISA